MINASHTFFCGSPKTCDLNKLSYYFFVKVEATEDGNLMLNGKEIHIFNSRDPADLDWKSVGAEYVIDSTGKFNTLEKCQPHLDNGAKKVLITAPSGKSIERY